MLTTEYNCKNELPKIPFLETSYHLQSASDNNNCVIYTLNNIKSIRRMLQDLELLTKLLELSKEKSKDSFQIAFTEGIKPYLPQYFDCNEEECTAHTPKELASYHAKETWDIGSKFIEEYICAEVIETHSIIGERNTCMTLLFNIFIV
jgi:hypothetical protein